MVAAGTHVNAVGAITPERTEFEPALLARCAAVVADSVPQVKNLSSEFMRILRPRTKRNGARCVRCLPWWPKAKAGRAGADLTLFKAMGMGISDLALGIEILRRAGEQAPRPRNSRTRNLLDCSPEPARRSTKERPMIPSVSSIRPVIKPSALDLWPAIVIPKEAIDAEVERLAKLAASGERPAALDHRPSARRKGQWPRPRHPGRARCAVARRADRPVPAELDAGEFCHPRRRPFDRRRQALSGRICYDVWNTPSMQHYWHGNDSKRAPGAADLFERRAARADEHPLRRGEPAAARTGQARGAERGGQAAPDLALRNHQAR